MPQTNYTNATITQVLRWAALNMRRWDRGVRPQPMVFVGPPGCGKTTMLRNEMPQVVADYHGVSVDDVCVVTFTVADKDEVEISGPAIPYKDPETGRVEFQFSPSPLLKLIRNEQERTGAHYVIVILDEMAAATQGGQKVIASALDPAEHSIGGDPLGDHVYVFGTGNRAEDRAGSASFLKHLPNRCKVMNITFSMSGLRSFWERKKLNPLAIECAMAYEDQEFFESAVPKHDEAYCTPRSLENMSYDLDVIMSMPDFDGHLTPDHRDYLSTTIGRKSADVLMTWINRHDQLPTAQDILNNPHSARVPEQTGYQSVAAHIALGAVENERSANAALHYIRRLRTDLQVPLLVKLIKESNAHGWCFTSDEAIDFLQKYRDLLPLAWD